MWFVIQRRRLLQTLKEEIKNNILNAARSEFSINGFEYTSIKSITRRANTSTTNVYNYFTDKDALFKAVVEDTLDEVKSFVDRLNRPSQQRQVASYTLDAQKGVILAFVQLILSHAEDFKLLFFKSAGSSLSNFRDQMVESLADALENWIHAIQPNRNLSRFFICSIARFYIGPMEQLLLQEGEENIGPEQMQEFLMFVYGGWKHLLQPEKNIFAG